MRYSVQTIESKKEGKNYRITDNIGDNRIGTCYDEYNADLICNELNYYADKNLNKCKHKTKATMGKYLICVDCGEERIK